MKTNTLLSTVTLAGLLFAATSCKKENSSTLENADLQAAVANAAAIAVDVTAGGDSIYVVNTCSRGSRKDSAAFSSLPAAASSYLTANYAGYTAQRAFAIKDASGTLQGYVAIIKYNGNPVGVKFDASGNFVSVLEQREGDDLRRGRGHHEGGCFENRDGRQRDTVALTALPSAITSYYASNYTTDTLAAAFKNKDGNYVVISRNGGIFAAVFTTSGTYVSRTQLPAHNGRANAVAQTALPTNVQTYLSTTYPAYVFNKAFAITQNGTTQGYVVIIEANSTRYAVEFDAAGAFVKVKTIR